MGKKYSVETAATVLSMSFAEGETISVDVASLPENVRQFLMLHGLKQKLGDAMAGKEVAEGRGHVERIVAALTAGDVTVRTPGSAKTSLLAEAIARATGQDVADVVESLEQLDDEQIKAVKAHPEVKVAMAEIKAEREKEKAQKAGVEGSSLASLFG